VPTAANTNHQKNIATGQLNFEARTCERAIYATSRLTPDKLKKEDNLCFSWVTAHITVHALNKKKNNFMQGKLDYF